MGIYGQKTGFRADLIQHPGGLSTWGSGSFGQIGDGTTNSKSFPSFITDNQYIDITGYEHVTAIRSDGTLWAWGGNYSEGQLGNGTVNISYSSPIQIGSLTNWKQVSSKRRHTLAVKTDGTLWAWGAGLHGALGNGAFNINYSSPVQVGSLTNWKEVQTGSNFYTMAIKTDGTLWGWGHNEYGQLGNNTRTTFSLPIQIGLLTNWSQVSCGYNQTAAIKTDGTLWAWGFNESGQLGNGTVNVHYSSPIQIGSLTNWSQVSQGRNSAAAVKTDGTLWSWGLNDYGQLGNGNTIYYSSPIQVGALTNWKLVACSELGATLSIKTDGTLWAWGRNNNGRLGNGTTINYSSPIQVGSLTNWKKVELTFSSSVGINDVQKSNKSLLYVTGYNASGQLGNGTVNNISFPTVLSPDSEWIQGLTGFTMFAGIKSDYTLWVCGTDGYGGLGNGTVNVKYSSPIQVGSLTNWKQVSVPINLGPTAAIKTDGTLWTWGRNNNGQLGNGTDDINYSSPIQIGSLTNWKQIASDGKFMAAIKTDGTLWTWGWNIHGQLGNGNIIDYSSPVQVGSLTNWKEVSVTSGNGLVMAIKTDGTLWTWGDNFFGSLGNGTNGNKYSSPIQIGSLTNWKKVVTSRYTTSAIKTDGTLWTWGYNDNGQLGNGTTINYSSPIQVGSLTNWSDVSASRAMFAIKKDGTLWAWGQNTYGSLGNGTTGQYSSPIQIGSLTNWTAIFDGYAGLVGISDISQDLGQRYVSKDYLLDVYPNIASATGARTSPGLWAWGYNTQGVLGNGTTVRYSSPVQIGSLTNWKQVSVGSINLDTTGAIKTDGTLWTWGRNQYGQLGNGTTISYSSPIQIGSLTNWKQVSTRFQQTAAVKTDGTLWTCGYNIRGGLGNGTRISYSSPIQIGSLTNWKQVSCGYQSIYAIKTDGTLWACGYDQSGQLGNNANANYSSPIQIGSLTNWKQVAGAREFAMAVKTDGTLWGWGRNQNGQLGNGNTITYSSPVQIGSLTNWKQVEVGLLTNYGAAIKTDGTLWTWGYNLYGNLGNGTTIDYSSPIQIGSLTNWKQVSASYTDTVCLKTDGTLWTWGFNIGGLTANESTSRYSSPIQIGSLTNWKQAVAGAYNIIAIADGYY